MAKQAKPWISVDQLRQANAALDNLLELRRRIDQYVTFTGQAATVTASLDRPGGSTPLVFVLPAATILGDLEEEEERLCAVLHGLGVEVPIWPPTARGADTPCLFPPVPEAA